jgi:hypothetical protein
MRREVVCGDAVHDAIKRMLKLQRKAAPIEQGKNYATRRLGIALQ